MGWYNNNWQYRIEITVPAEQVSANVSAFPVLIKENSCTAAFWAHVKSDGSDIVITASDGTTKLSRELVDIDTSGETIELWFKGNLSSTTDNTFYIYYGYSGASESDDAAAWSSFMAVFHMGETSPADSTGTYTATHVAGATVTASGKLYDAHDYVDTGRVDLAVTGSSIKSISFWYYPRSRGGGDYGSVFGSSGYTDGIRHIGTDAINLRRSGSILLSSTATFNVWKHLEFIYRASSGRVYLYENGSYVADAAFTGWYDIAHLTGIAATSDRGPDGILDEMRISGTEFSAGWVAAEYANQNSPSSFVVFGTEETGGITVGYKSLLAFWAGGAGEEKNEITGSADITEGADTLTAAGTVAIAGSADITEGGDTLAAAGTVDISGSADITEGGDTVSSSGTVAVSGSADITEGGDTLAAAGTVDISGSADITEASDTVSSSGTVAVNGSADITEGGDTLTAAGTVDISGSADITEEADTLAASGTVDISGSADITEEADTLTASGTVDISGSADITEASDTVSSSGTVAISGSADITEEADTLTASGTVAIAGSADITEGADTLAASGAVAIAGSADITEGGDTLAASGRHLLDGIDTLLVTATVQRTLTSETVVRRAVPDTPVRAANSDTPVRSAVSATPDRKAIAA
jgi:hypothetical protein